MRTVLVTLVILVCALVLVAGGYLAFRVMGIKLPGVSPARESMGLADLLGKAQAVVEVTVLRSEPRYDEHDHMVYTFSQMRVDKALAGLLPIPEFNERLLATG